jgi:hypothetical protein
MRHDAYAALRQEYFQAKSRDIELSGIFSRQNISGIFGCRETKRGQGLD